jgi:hypothetical protein
MRHRLVNGLKIIPGQQLPDTNGTGVLEVFLHFQANKHLFLITVLSEMRQSHDAAAKGTGAPEQLEKADVVGITDRHLFTQIDCVGFYFHHYWPV